MENLLKIMDERFVYCSHETTDHSIVIQAILNSSQAECPSCQPFRLQKPELMCIDSKIYLSKD